MCGIIASFNLDKFKELILLNQKRGSFSYSFTMYNIITKEVNIFKDFGPFDFKVFPKVNNSNIYYIGHIQAPTGGLIKKTDRIHPSSFSDTFLYHNGILKPETIETLKTQLNIDSDWDTYLLHMNLLKNGWVGLNHIDGSFGCLYVNQDVYAFTNDLINLYVDEHFNLSSVYFKNSVRLNPNCVYKFVFNDFHYEIIDAFKTKHNPYFIMEDN